jgi:outer membrane protein assembly factor BamB
VLRLVSALVVAGAALTAGGGALATAFEPARATTLATGLPTTASGRYLIAGGWATPGTMLRVGNSVYVGGAFSRIANRTGSAIVLPTSGGTPEPGFPEVAGGSVTASVADETSGWYMSGSFTNVGGVERPGLAHVRGDDTVDMAFSPGDLGDVRALALVGNVLYAGGIQPGTYFVPVLRALDATTGDALPISFDVPADARNLVALVATANRLYVAFGSTMFDSRVVAFDAATGARVWVHPFSFEASHVGAATLALDVDRTKLLVGGEFDDAGNENLVALDVRTGMPTAPTFRVPTGITSMAVNANDIYVARHRDKRGSSGLDVINLITGLEKSWGIIRAEQLFSYGTMLYIAGRTAADDSEGVRARVYSAPLYGNAKGVLKKVSPPLGGTASTLGAQGGRLFVGGTFSSAGGVARANLASFDIRTGKLLPWRPSVDGVVTGLAATNGKIYIGGYFSRLNGKARRNLAAVTATGAGRLLPWRPGLSYSSGVSLAIGHGRVFVGGTFIPAGQKRTPGKPIRFTHLAAFSASGPGARIPFASHALNTAPGGALGGGGVLAVRGRTLLLAEPSGVAAFSVEGNGRHELWRRLVRGTVNAFATSGATLYLGGRFSQVGGQPRSNLASLALDRRGAVLPFAPPVTHEVGALAPVRGSFVYSVATPIPPQAWHQALGAVAPDGTILPWRFDADGSVDCIAPFSGGLAVAGTFDWLGPTGHQAAGRFGWIR